MKNKKNLIFTLLFFASSTSIFAQKAKVIQVGNPEAMVYDLSFYNEGNNLAIAEESTILLYETTDYQLTKALNGHSNTILSLSISSVNKQMVSAGRDSTIAVWDLNNISILEKLDYHKAVITSIIIHENLIISGGTDNQIIIYDRHKREILHVLDNHIDHVLDLALHPDNNTIASSGADGKIITWDIKSGKVIDEITTNSSVRGVSYKPDGTRLSYCNDKGKVVEYNLKQGVESKTYKFGSNWLTDLNYNYNGRSFVVGNINGSIRIKHPFGQYQYKSSAPITKTLIKPNEETYIKVAFGTLGKGTFIIDGRDMKSKR
jgi:WD40 repeat protein